MSARAETTPSSLLITDLLSRYRRGEVRVRDVIEEVVAAIDSAPDRNVWITRLTREQLAAYVDAIEQRSPHDMPLYGIPFAIKDNIDLANVPTTAACPEFAYTPRSSATVVQKLIAAGAIPIGKTNLDQFATGLVGTRSPYGACQNGFNAAYISGGSSSGSAVAVATGLVSFALGTDTAGSGRVPAAFNNLIGLKPSCGLLSTSGVVPACRSLDAVSIFALSAADAAMVLEAAQGFDASDPYSKPRVIESRVTTPLRVGVPDTSELEFFGDSEYRKLFREACEQMIALGAIAIPVSIAPFLETARLLYEGPWLAERYAAIESFIKEQPEALHPITRQIIERGAKPSAVDAFRSQYRLKALERETQAIWRDIDVLLLPTAGTIYTIDAVLADPITLNSNLGFYTNFVNLLDLAAVSVPAGFRDDGLPFGASLVAPATSEATLIEWAGRIQHASVATVGALVTKVPEPFIVERRRDEIEVVVCGAHLSGLPLNHQLVDRGAHLVRATTTSPNYRFYALPGGPPKRPGLVRVQEGGAAIAVEVWSVPSKNFGSFVAGIPSPLGIGKVELADGTLVSGFICEPYATVGAEDITEFGDWRRYLAAK